MKLRPSWRSWSRDWRQLRRPWSRSRPAWPWTPVTRPEMMSGQASVVSMLNVWSRFAPRPRPGPTLRLKTTSWQVRWCTSTLGTGADLWYGVLKHDLFSWLLFGYCQPLTNCGRLHDIYAAPADLTAGGAVVKTSNGVLLILIITTLRSIVNFFF